jgi:uncharacterized Fe-S cluster-containing protein
MDDSFLLRFALLASVIGLAALFAYSTMIDRTNVKKLFLEEETAEIEGKVVKVSNGEAATYVTVERTIRESIIVFSNVSLKEGDIIRAEGKMDGQLIAQKIERLD